MELSNNEAVRCLRVWIWLLVLLAAGILAIVAPVPRPVAMLVIFGAATAEAFLVGRNYMHLKSEHLLIYVLALVPVALVLALSFVLTPDIARHGLR